MVFVGAAIMPHGALPFDGDPHSENKACLERHKKLSPELKTKFNRLYEGMCQTGEEVAKMNPDLIILHTPHGITLTSSVGVYMNNMAEGSALWNDCWDDFKADIELDSCKADALLKHFQHDGVTCQGIISSHSTILAPLRWGEVIPIWYVLRAMKKDVKFLIISQSQQPWPISSVSEDRLAVGRSLASFVDGLSERVALVISGDLAHSYDTDCTNTLYLPAPGWNLKSDHIAACAMERAYLGWVKALTDIGSFDSKTELPPSEKFWQHKLALPWLQKAADWQIKGYACGLVGTIALHAFLAHHTDKDVNISTQVMACEAPTYYGLMAAVFFVVK